VLLVLDLLVLEADEERLLVLVLAGGDGVEEGQL
jgi:hypothetical protein